MRRLVALAVVPAVTLALADDASAQSSRERVRNRNPRPSAFTVSAGIAGPWGGPNDHVVHTSRGLVGGGEDPGPHVAFGAAFPWTGTALEVRVEAFYNQLRGPQNTLLGLENGGTARMATRVRNVSRSGPAIALSSFSVRPSSPARCCVTHGMIEP